MARVNRPGRNRPNAAKPEDFRYGQPSAAGGTGLGALGRRELKLSRELTLVEDGWPCAPGGHRRLNITFGAELSRESTESADEHVILTVWRSDNALAAMSTEHGEDSTSSFDVLVPIGHLRDVANAFNDLIADTERGHRQLGSDAPEIRVVTDLAGRLVKAGA
jgi:hypothetical protein